MTENIKQISTNLWSGMRISVRRASTFACCPELTSWYRVSPTESPVTGVCGRRDVWGKGGGGTPHPDEPENRKRPDYEKKKNFQKETNPVAEKQARGWRFNKVPKTKASDATEIEEGAHTSRGRESSCS